DRVREALAAAGGQRVCGGDVPSDAAYARGFFLQPTVYRDVQPDSPLAQDELFAPVLATLRASDVEEAIALANRTQYGLSASLFTRDLGSALRYIRDIEAG